MKLVIIRHGKAEEPRPGVSDEERRLTDEGRKDVECVARTLPWRVEIVCSSPLKRAVETAEILMSVHGSELRIIDELRPKVIPLDTIARLEMRSVTALVGHAPYIEQLLQELIGGGNVRLSPGAAAGIETETIEKGKGVLVYLITPEICKAVHVHREDRV